MEIYRLLALRDNYIFLLYDRVSQMAAVIDPGEAKPVFQQLEALDAQLVAIFQTHHHHDHIGGSRQLLKAFPNLRVYGSAYDHEQGRIPGQNVVLCDGDRVEFAGRSAEVMFVPGHTLGHIAYYFLPTDDHSMGELFCGDVLFSAGCGRLFEGTAQQAVDSIGRLRSLPDTTRLWCAHEYTQANLKFALTIDAANPDLHAYAQLVQAQRSRHEPTVPSSIGLERKINPFLRWDVAAIRSAVNGSNPADTFAKLRQLKESA